MEPQNKEGEVLLPHHEQQSLCTTRLPYRQGRKLTAIKVYTVNNESNHLLIFGVPSLNLRQEAKALFSKFGKITQFNLSKQHAAEVFTETYHAAFEKIQSARIAKRMLDTKNFYGGSLHVCYAPELEDLKETRSKLLQRQKDVIYRLRNLQREVDEKVSNVAVKDTNELICENKVAKLNMGVVNTINLENNTVKKRKINKDPTFEKRFKSCFVSNPKKYDKSSSDTKNSNSDCDFRIKDSNIEIIDCTSTNFEAITNINVGYSEDNFEKLQLELRNEKNVNDTLNYNNFGNEIVRKVPTKAVNKIQFNVNKR